MAVQVLLLLIGFLFVFIVFGIGVVFGGGEQPDTANGINSLIALGTVLSACSGLGTLLLLIRFRDDWKHPKIDESRLNFIANLRRWQRFFKLHVETLQKNIPNQQRYLVFHEMLLKEIEKEKEYWQSLESSFDVMLYYAPSLESLNTHFEDIIQIRCEINELIKRLEHECSNNGQMNTGVGGVAIFLAMKQNTAMSKIKTLSDKIASAL
ncbi:hypothetical protein ACP51X_004577 [Vibrio vulnificus]